MIPELEGRVTLLDKNNQVITRLGDNPNQSLWANNNIDKNQWQDGLFLSPHSARWDDDGNLYVMDSLNNRIVKVAK